MTRVNLIHESDRDAWRRCRTCGDVKRSEMFVRSADRNMCLACKAAFAVKWRAAHGPTIAARQRQYYRENKAAARARGDRWIETHREARMINSARTRAKNKGLAFNITEADIVIPDTCPVLGIEILKTKAPRQTDGSPSLDRIDNSVGYVRGNVAVVSLRANNLKNDGTADEHERIAAWMRANERKAQS